MNSFYLFPFFSAIGLIAYESKVRLLVARCAHAGAVLLVASVVLSLNGELIPWGIASFVTGTLMVLAGVKKK